MGERAGEGEERRREGERGRGQRFPNVKTSPTFAVEDILAQDIAGSLQYSYLKDFKQYFSVFTSSLGLSCIIQTFGLFWINMKKNIKYKS